MRIILIGCGVQQRPCGPHPANDLWRDPIFAARREYAEAAIESTAVAYFIITPDGGLLSPNVKVRPSSIITPMQSMTALERVEWRCRIIRQLIERVDIEDLFDDASLRDVLIEIHAGHEFAAKLADVLRANGFAVKWPVEHCLTVGHQLKWYRDAKQAL